MIRDNAHAALLQERYERARHDAADAEQAAIDDMHREGKPYLALWTIVKAAVPEDADAIRLLMEQDGELCGIAYDVERPDDMTPSQLASAYLDSGMFLDTAFEVLRRRAEKLREKAEKAS
jgi:hypothetical protein